MVKRNVTIPVIGNGDVTSFSEAQDRLQSTGCDAVMIGRGALGNPWVFSSKGRPSDYKNILPGVLRHLDLMQQYLNVNRVFAVVKNHIGRYFKDLPGSSMLLRKIYDSASFSEMQNLLVELLKSKSLDNDSVQL